MVDLEKLYEWFNTNRANIIAEHINDYVLLSNNTAVGYYKTMEDALSDANKRGIALGTFLVQKCIPEQEDIVTFYSQRVAFA